MPLVRIDVGRREPAATVRAIADGVHAAMVATIDVPPDDRFQIVTVHEPGAMIVDPGYLGIARTDAAVIVNITLRAGRSNARKQALYRQIADNLAQAGLRAQDVMIVLTENTPADWSFGDGNAQYLG